MEVNSPDEMLDVWDARHKAFHNAIAAGCNSPHLLQIRENLFDQVERYRHLWLYETVFSDEALARKRRSTPPWSRSSSLATPTRPAR